MLFLGGKSNGWQNFNLNHRKVIVETILMITSYFFLSKRIHVVFFSSNMGDSVSLHLKLAVLSEKMGENHSPVPEMNSVTKRANLMDTINKLSAGKADIADKKSTLDQLFGNPSIAQR